MKLKDLASINVALLLATLPVILDDKNSEPFKLVALVLVIVAILLIAWKASDDA